MSTSATSRRTTRDAASPIMSWGPISVNPISNVEPKPAETPLTGALFTVNSGGSPADRQDGSVIPIAGTVTSITGQGSGDPVNFTGELGPGRIISFSLKFKEMAYSFSGVVSLSFGSMAGLVTIRSLHGNAEDEATWSSQARGVPPAEEDKSDHPPRNTAAGDGRK